MSFQKPHVKEDPRIFEPALESISFIHRVLDRLKFELKAQKHISEILVHSLKVLGVDVVFAEVALVKPHVI